MSEYLTKPATEHDIRGFRDWLLTMDPAGTYTYSRPRSCLVAQYMRATGYQNVSVGPFDFTYYLGEQRVDGELPSSVNRIAAPNEGDTDTYGNALLRAEIELSRFGV